MTTRKQDHPITIKQDAQKPEPMEVMAGAIVSISEAVKKLKSSPLKPRTLYILIKDTSGVPLSTIEKVFNAAESLEKTYLK